MSLLLAETEKALQAKNAEIERLRSMLNEALESLDVIAEDPADPHDGVDHYSNCRVLAKNTARYVRNGTRTAST